MTQRVFDVDGKIIAIGRANVGDGTGLLIEAFGGEWGADRGRPNIRLWLDEQGAVDLINAAVNALIGRPSPRQEGGNDRGGD